MQLHNQIQFDISKNMMGKLKPDNPQLKDLSLFSFLFYFQFCNWMKFLAASFMNTHLIREFISSFLVLCAIYLVFFCCFKCFHISRAVQAVGSAKLLRGTGFIVLAFVIIFISNQNMISDKESTEKESILTINFCIQSLIFYFSIS